MHVRRMEKTVAWFSDRGWIRSGCSLFVPDRYLAGYVSGDVVQASIPVPCPARQPGWRGASQRLSVFVQWHSVRCQNRIAETGSGQACKPDSSQPSSSRKLKESTVWSDAGRNNYCFFLWCNLCFQSGEPSQYCAAARSEPGLRRLKSCLARKVGEASFICETNSLGEMDLKWQKKPA